MLYTGSAFEGAFLLLHFLVDGVDGLGASFNMELQSGFFELLLYRCNEGGNVLVTRCLGLIQFFLDMVVNFLFCIFQ